MDDRKLISLVQNFEVLYNLQHSDYSNQQRRDNAWEEISKVMKQPDNTCRERWTRIRENHRKALNLRKTKSGPSAAKLKAPKFERELSFLVPYLFDGENRPSNFSFPALEFNSECGLDDNDQDEIEQSRKIIGTIPENCSISSRDSTHTPQKRLKVNKSPEPSVVSRLWDYLEEKKKSNRVSDERATQDILTNFFINMAQTVKTFPLKDQVEIKGKLFQLVNSVEIRIANESPSPITHLSVDVNPFDITNQNDLNSSAAVESSSTTATTSHSSERRSFFEQIHSVPKSYNLQ